MFDDDLLSPKESKKALNKSFVSADDMFSDDVSSIDLTTRCKKDDTSSERDNSSDDNKSEISFSDLKKIQQKNPKTFNNLRRMLNEMYKKENKKTLGK